MKEYLYPQNLKAKANLWLWSLKDFAVIGIGALLSIVALVNLGWMMPAVATLVYAFLTIRLDETTMLDYIKSAIEFLITTQQYYEWR